MATKRKGRRFDEGGYTEDSEALADEDYGDNTTREERLAMVRSPRKAAADEETSPSRATQAEVRKVDNASEAPTKQSFKEAFAAARKGGGKTFEWNGKKYTTEMASAPSKAAAKAPMGAGAGRGGQGGPTAQQNASRYKSETAGAGRGGQGGPTADELDREAFARAEKRAFTPPSSEDTQKGLEIMAGGPSLKAVAAAAKGLANRAPAAGAKLREYIQPQLAAPTKRLTGPAAKEVADVTPKALPAPKSSAAAEAAEKSVPTKGREDVTNPLMWMAGPKNAGKFRGKKALDESDTTGGAVGYKKGGNVRGWGIARGARKAKIV